MPVPNSHQQFLLGTFDLRDQGLFEVITIAPFPVSGWR